MAKKKVEKTNKSANVEAEKTEKVEGQRSIRDVAKGLVNTINSVYKKPVMTMGSDATIEKIKTGIFAYDFETGGIPRGRWVINQGKESTCKSTFTYKVGGKFQHICGNCIKGTITEVNYKGIKVVLDRNNPDNENYEQLLDDKKKPVLHKYTKQPIIISKKFFADNKKRNVYSPGEEITHDKSFTLYQYELECSHCSAPDYSLFVLVDSEHNYTKKWARKHGVIHHYVLLVDSEYSEQTGEIVREVLNTGRVQFVAIDSVASHPPKVEDEAAFEDQQMGVQARVWNKIVRVLTAKLNSSFKYIYKLKNGTPVEEIKKPEPTIMPIQQYRSKIGSYGNPLETGAGMGLKYASSTTNDFSQGEKDWISKEDGEIRGQWFNFVVPKQKADGHPFTQGRFYMNFQTGEIDNTESIIDYALKYGIAKQSGAWFEYEGQKFQGKEKFLNWINENLKVLDAFEKKLYALKEANETS